MKTCPSCSAQTQPAAHFCSGCGAALDGEPCEPILLSDEAAVELRAAIGRKRRLPLSRMTVPLAVMGGLAAIGIALWRQPEQFRALSNGVPALSSLVGMATRVGVPQDAARAAFEGIGGTDDLYAARDAYQSFLARFPHGEFAESARRELATVQQAIHQYEQQEQVAIGLAAKQHDADAALQMLEQFAEGYPFSGEALRVAMSRYRSEAEHLRAQRRAASDLGVRIGKVSTRWVRNWDLEVPMIRIEVTNVTERPITYLKIVARFLRSGTKETFGGEAVSYVVSSLNALPFEPGETRTAQLTGDTGYRGEGGLLENPKLDVQIFAVTKSGGEPLPITESRIIE